MCPNCTGPLNKDRYLRVIERSVSPIKGAEMTRKVFTKAIKAEVAIEAIKGQKTVSELSSEYGVHASQIGTWKLGQSH